VLARPVIEPGPNAPKSGTQPIEPTSRQLKELRHEDFAGLAQFCAKTIT